MELERGKFYVVDGNFAANVDDIFILATFLGVSGSGDRWGLGEI